MMSSKFTSGIAAVSIYLLILGLVFYYFGYHSNEKSKHYVTKNSKAISVSLAGAKKPVKHLKSSTKPKAKPKPKHTRPKPVKSKKPAKQITKPSKKPAKKPIKKIKAKDLFSSVKTSPKPKSKSKPPKTVTSPKSTKPKGSRQGKSSIKKGKKADKGVENRYLSNVQDKLYGWPSQPSFAGAKVVIGLIIHPNGSFEYEVLQPSSNPEYNRVITQYLKQLKNTGFGPTPEGKSYKFKVDIIAK